MPIYDNLVDVFPTPVYKDKMSIQVSKEELDHLYQLETKTNYGNSSSIDQYILDDPKLSNIKSNLEEKVKEYFKEVYKPNDSIEIYITQSWLNHSKPGEHHHKHCHPNSFISGVFYLSAESSVDKIWFYKREYAQISIVPTEFNPWNSDSWWIPVETNDLVLFPSATEHMVETVEENNSRNTRTSIAFNTFVKGNIGSYGASNELKL